jgi:hypothetical protein
VPEGEVPCEEESGDEQPRRKWWFGSRGIEV